MLAKEHLAGLALISIKREMTDPLDLASLLSRISKVEKRRIVKRFCRYYQC